MRDINFRVSPTISMDFAVSKNQGWKSDNINRYYTGMKIYACII